MRRPSRCRPEISVAWLYVCLPFTDVSIEWDVSRPGFTQVGGGAVHHLFEFAARPIPSMTTHTDRVLRFGSENITE